MDPETATPADTGDAARLTDKSDSAAAQQPTTQDADVNVLADTLIEESPEPQPHAIQQRTEQEAARVSQTAETVKQFPEFDPAIHATNPDGTPQLTPTGRLAKIRKPRGSAPKLNIPAGTAQSATASPAQTKEAAARAGGAGCANLVIALSVGIGGEDFLPRRDKASGLDEKAMLESAFADYFVATGKTDLPPGWALAAAMSMYILPRLGMQKTQSRISRAKTWFVVKWLNWKLARRGIKARVRSAADIEPAREALSGRAAFKNQPDAPHDER